MTGTQLVGGVIVVRDFSVNRRHGPLDRHCYFARWELEPAGLAVAPSPQSSDQWCREPRPGGRLQPWQKPWPASALGPRGICLWVSDQARLIQPSRTILKQRISSELVASSRAFQNAAVGGRSPQSTYRSGDAGGSSGRHAGLVLATESPGSAPDCTPDPQQSDAP